MSRGRLAELMHEWQTSAARLLETSNYRLDQWNYHESRADAAEDRIAELEKSDRLGARAILELAILCKIGWGGGEQDTPAIIAEAFKRAALSPDDLNLDHTKHGQDPDEAATELGEE